MQKTEQTERGRGRGGGHGTEAVHLPSDVGAGEPGRGLGAGWLAMVGGTALALRALAAYHTADVPLLRHLIGDAAGYYAWAQRLAGGGWWKGESFYQAPLYPYLLGVLFSLFGDGVVVVRAAQALGGAAACVCIAYGSGRVFGGRTGIVAGLMLAGYAPAVFFDGIVQKASLACLLVCALIAALAHWSARRGRGGAVLIGVLIGLLVLTRENALVWAPVLLVWIFLGAPKNGGMYAGVGPLPDGRAGVRRERVARAAFYLLGVALVLGPVVARNRLVGGEWSISTFQAGPNFYIGNHHGASGRYEPLVRGHETPAFERRDATMLAQRATGREMTPKEVSRYWQRRTWEEIGADPVGWLGLLARKFMMVWNAYEVSDAESLYVYADYSPALRALNGVWHFGVLCPLAVVGVASTWRQRRRLWVWYALIVSMALAVAFFYVMARYRYPLAPLLIPWAAVGGLHLWKLARSATIMALGRYVVIGLAAATFVNWPMYDRARLDALAWMNVGVALAESGDVAEATEMFERAVARCPESAEANNNLALALAVGQEYGRAIGYYEAALRADPTLMNVDYNLGVALEHVGRVEAAIGSYRRALEVDPADGDARAALERLLKGRGKNYP